MTPGEIALASGITLIVGVVLGVGGTLFYFAVRDAFGVSASTFNDPDENVFELAECNHLRVER